MVFSNHTHAHTHTNILALLSNDHWIEQTAMKMYDIFSARITNGTLISYTNVILHDMCIFAYFASLFASLPNYLTKTVKTLIYLAFGSMRVIFSNL